jgi:hypothetical protein
MNRKAILTITATLGALFFLLVVAGLGWRVWALDREVARRESERRDVARALHGAENGPPDAGTRQVDAGPP